ncbi:MAG: NosD domain-containing protein [Candidatus Hatepunaea meridiana]|nr:NosD domain-containing protein [Candidatus Hatepunaea meridiana]
MICNRFIQFLTLNLILCICTPSLGDIIHVPDDYETIQEATENAENGDTIMVAPGEYPRAAGFVHEPSPIWFIGDPNHETIIDLGGDRHNGFSSQYARIFVENFVIRNNSGGRPGVGLFRTHGEVRNCIFQELSVAIVINEGSALIESCKFDNNTWNLRLDLNEDQTIIRKNRISNCGIGIDIGRGRSAVIENNTLVGSNTAIVIRAYGANYVIRDNIISFCTSGIAFFGYPEDGSIDEVVGRYLDIAYNCLYDIDVDFWADLGDSVGVFNPTPGSGMLSEDPLFVNSDEGNFHLQEDSPCINAGDPESNPDPDGTCADIGAFYFHLYPDIYIEPEYIEFNDIQTGTSDSTSFLIRNTGHSSLVTTQQLIIPEESPFTIGAGRGEFELEPDSIHQTWIIFSPDLQDEYEAAYCIESNDPDENSLEIPLYGTALRVKQEGGGLPIELKIVDIFPNPFNSQVTIRYSLQHKGTVQLSVIDPFGRQILLFNWSNKPQGNHTFVFDSYDLPTGLYFVQLRYEEEVRIAKMICLK